MDAQRSHPHAISSTAEERPAHTEQSPAAQNAAQSQTAQAIEIEWTCEDEHCWYTPDEMLADATEQVLSWVEKHVSSTWPYTFEKYSTYLWDDLANALRDHAATLTDAGQPDLAAAFTETAESIGEELHGEHCDCATLAYESAVEAVNYQIKAVLGSTRGQTPVRDGDKVKPFAVLYRDNDHYFDRPIYVSNEVTFENLTHQLVSSSGLDGFRVALHADRRYATVSFSNRGWGGEHVLWFVCEPDQILLVESIAALGYLSASDYLPFQLNGVAYSDELIAALAAIRESSELRMQVEAYHSTYTETCEEMDLVDFIGHLRANTEFFTFSADLYTSVAVLAKTYEGSLTEMLKALQASVT